MQRQERSKRGARRAYIRRGSACVDTVEAALSTLSGDDAEEAQEV
jgi:hypothetical protein